MNSQNPPENSDVLLFQGQELLVRGELASVALAYWNATRSDEEQRLALYWEESGASFDIDASGSIDETLCALRQQFPEAKGEASASEAQEVNEKKPQGRGRPKLGVVAREITLLPRHWAWLSTQRGGASATLRRLIDAERRATRGAEERARQVASAHQFMWDIAGNTEGFEEASRSLFAHDWSEFREHIKSWPSDIVEQLERYVTKAEAAEQ